MRLLLLTFSVMSLVLCGCLAVGMDDATLGRLFRAFQQADNTVHRTHGGTGLGLSISKALVELWGGRIYVRSQPGKSTTISIGHTR